MDNKKAAEISDFSSFFLFALGQNRPGRERSCGELCGFAAIAVRRY